MKSTLFSFILTFFSSTIFAQSTTWGYDLSHAKLSFSISHFGISETEGKFEKFDGIVYSDKPDFADAKIELTIDVNSINTGNAQRDGHLKSKDFFETEKYPTITFKSKSLTPVGKNKYDLVGDLTMHGVTREITLAVIYKGTVVDPYKNTKAGFKISGTLDRTKYGLVWNGKLSTGDALLGNEVMLDINIELQKK